MSGRAERREQQEYGAKAVLIGKDEISPFELEENLKRQTKVLRAQQHYPQARVLRIEFTSINSFMLTTDGKLYSWGGHSLCLGREAENENYKEIGLVKFPKNAIITTIAAGKSHILALTSDNLVYSWGKNDKGQLGHGNEVGSEGYGLPKKIAELHDITQVFAGNNMSVAVNKDNKIWVWGQNKNDCLLINDEKTQISSVDHPKVNNKLSNKVAAEKGLESHINMNLKNKDKVAFYDVKMRKKNPLTKHQKEIDDLLTENDKIK